MGEYQYDRLVRSVIRGLVYKYQITGIDEEDMFQEGRLIVWKAEKDYQADKGTKFETYAWHCVHNRIVDIIRQQKGLTINLDDIETTLPGESLKDPVLWEILNQVLQDCCTEIERAIFNAYYQGYSYQEICKIFGINKKKVDNTIQKIHRQARSIYAD